MNNATLGETTVRLVRYTNAGVKDYNILSRLEGQTWSSALSTLRMANWIVGTSAKNHITATFRNESIELFLA